MIRLAPPLRTALASKPRASGDDPVEVAEDRQGEG